jgi:hypothetical protein
MIVLQTNAFMENVLTKLIRTDVNAILVMKETGVIKVRKRYIMKINNNILLNYTRCVLHALQKWLQAKNVKVKPCYHEMAAGEVTKDSEIWVHDLEKKWNLKNSFIEKT